MEYSIHLILLMFIMKCTFHVVAILFQEQYHLVENCDNYAPPLSSLYSTQIEDNIFRCVKQCQINLACQSFAYKYQTECLLSRKNVTSCDELESNNGCKTYKVCICTISGGDR